MALAIVTNTDIIMNPFQTGYHHGVYRDFVIGKGCM